MRFRLEQRFAQPVDDVEEAFVDPALFAEIGDRADLGRPELLDRRDEGDIVHLEVRYAFAGELGSTLAAVVDPAKITWVEHSTHDRANHRGRFHIVPDHYQGRLRCEGTLVLEDDGDGGTRRLAEGDLHVSLPLVGRKVERAVIDGLANQATTQARAVADWLSDGRADGG